MNAFARLARAIIDASELAAGHRIQSETHRRLAIEQQGLAARLSGDLETIMDDMGINGPVHYGGFVFWQDEHGLVQFAQPIDWQDLPPDPIPESERCQFDECSSRRADNCPYCAEHAEQHAEMLAETDPVPEDEQCQFATFDNGRVDRCGSRRADGLPYCQVHADEHAEMLADVDDEETKENRAIDALIALSMVPEDLTERVAEAINDRTSTIPLRESYVSRGQEQRIAAEAALAAAWESDGEDGE